MIDLDISLDLFPMLAATLAAVSCGILGNFLVLRRLSLMGDAISHSVLPGLVVAFLITTTRSPVVMFTGAAIAGVVTVVLVELVKRLGRVEAGAAMGVVFSVLFALGVLLIQQAAQNVDLDADCVLHGQLETLVWYGGPESLPELFRWSTLGAVPRQVVTLGVMCVLAFVFVGVLFKELRIAAFDPALATTQGINAGVMHFLLMVFVAGATVASFEAVGSILVVAMLVCPAATARLLTDRLRSQVVWSVVISLACGVIGYIAATAVPAAFAKDSVNAAGSMAVVAGVFVALAAVGSPRHGVVARSLRRRALALLVARDDLIAALFRANEAGRERVGIDRLRAAMIGSRFRTAFARARREGLVELDGADAFLTEKGEAAARELVRKHRLWEHYLVAEAGVAPDHVHDTAERLEHVGPAPEGGPRTDPHGRAIPGGAAQGERGG